MYNLDNIIQNLNQKIYNISFVNPYFSLLKFKSGGKSKIHIKKKNRGKFTEYCGGKVTDECIRKAKTSGNPTLIKRATFAANARKWKHAGGGIVGGNNTIWEVDMDALSAALDKAITYYYNKKYKLGAKSKYGSSIDCSGLIYNLLGDIGVKNFGKGGGTYYQQYKSDSTPIKSSELRKGDLIFYNPNKNGVSHVVMAWGNPYLKEDGNTYIKVAQSSSDKNGFNFAEINLTNFKRGYRGFVRPNYTPFMTAKSNMDIKDLGTPNPEFPIVEEEVPDNTRVDRQFYTPIKINN